MRELPVRWLEFVDAPLVPGQLVRETPFDVGIPRPAVAGIVSNPSHA
jgi:hypothetical protein